MYKNFPAALWRLAVRTVCVAMPCWQTFVHVLSHLAYYFKAVVDTADTLLILKKFTYMSTLSQQIIYANLSCYNDLHIITDAEKISNMSTDQRGRFKGTPMIAVEPATVTALQALVSYCHAHNLAMVPQGGNTGLCGGATPDASGTQILISLRRLRTVRHIDQLNATLTIEAGTTLQDIQNIAEQAGYLFPLSLASQGNCQIGGNLSTNAGGVHVLRYGMIRDAVLGLEVILSDGRLWSDLRGLRKDNTGYALKHLFIGAEGTLGIITAVTLKLFPRWSYVMGCWISVQTLDEVDKLLILFRQIAGDRLTAFEVMPELCLRWVQMSHPDWLLPAPLTPWTVWVELAENAPYSDLLSWFEAHMPKLKPWQDKLVITQTSREHHAAWQWRESISAAKKRAVIAINYDISLSISQLHEWIKHIQMELKKSFPLLGCTGYGHWGDGNLHWSVFVSREALPLSLSEIESDINTLIYNSIHAYGGSISAEHGLGQLKARVIEHYQAPIEREMMRSIKQALDPLHLMNPGKIFSIPVSDQAVQT